MQALNIQADLSNVALTLKSAPSNQTPDTAVSFASLVSSEIDKATGDKSAPVASNTVSSSNAISNEQKNPENKTRTVAEKKESSAEEKNISNDVKETAENATDSRNQIAENNTEDGKNEKNIALSAQKNAKKTAKTDVSDEKSAKSVSKKDKKSVKTVLNEKTPQENAEDAAKVLDIAAENASEMVSVSEIPATEISEAVEDVADVSAVAQAKTDSKNAIPEQPISVQEPEVSEEGETLIASAVENLKNADESEAGENGQADFSQKQTAQTAKTETAKKGASLTVHDERTEKVADVSVQKTAAEGAEIKTVSENAVEMTMANVTTANITSSNSQTASAVGSNYQSMLANQIQNNAPEFVKAGSIVLRDNNQGTINLILHPESLGNVKVSLQLTDKVIAGQIVVQSQEAYNAFRDSMDSLKQAFAQNGFDTANFNLAMGGDMMNGNGGNHEGRADAPFVANRAYGDYAESADMAASSLADYAGGTDGVDIVA